MGRGVTRTGAESIVAGADGNVYAGGFSTDNAGSHFTVVSLAPSGVERWVYRYINPGPVPAGHVRCMAMGADGSIYAGGYTGNNTGYYFTVVSLAPSGEERWVYRYINPGPSSGVVYSIAAGVDGNLYAAGGSRRDQTHSGLTVVSLTPSGGERWVYRYDGPGTLWYNAAYSIAVGVDGSLYVAGLSFGSGTGADFTVVSLTPSGGERWVYRYDGSANGWRDVAKSIVTGPDGNLYAAGLSWGSGTWADFTVVSLAPSGGERWVYRYNGPADQSDVALSIVAGPDGNLYAAGSSGPDAMDDDLTVVSLTPFVSGLAVATGGGWIPGDPPGPGNKRTFGFNAHSEGGAVWGQLQFNDHATKMKVHSDTVRTLVVQAGDTVVDFSGDCRVDGTAGYTFDCEVMDRGEPGRGVDSFGIDVYDENGNLYYSAGGVLGGGNIQIRLPDDGYVKGGPEPETQPGDEPKPPLARDVAPASHSLVHNRPNPFTDKTTISFHLPSSSHATLEICDITGRLVATLVDAQLAAGLHTATWETGDAPSGVYMYKLACGDFTATKKLVLLR